MIDHVSVSVAVAAPPDVVYGLVSDVTRMGEWSPETTKCRWLAGATAPEVGAKFAGTNRGKGRRWSTRCEVTTADPGKRFAFHVTSGPVPIADWSYDLESDGTSTTVTESWQDLRPGWMKRLSGPVMGVADRATHNEAGMRITLDNLRAAAEATPG